MTSINIPNTSFAPIRRRWMPPEMAIESLLVFEERFGSSHSLLACHAAFPLVLTAELVNLIRINFLEDMNIPWHADADFLLAPFCYPIDTDLYQIDPTARELLLDDLLDRCEDGQQRLLRLADFLIAYLDQQGRQRQKSEIARIQRWVAWSYLEPEKVVDDLRGILNTAPYASKAGHHSDGPLEVAMILEMLREPLQSINNDENYRQLEQQASVIVHYWYRTSDDKSVPSELQIPPKKENATEDKRSTRRRQTSDVYEILDSLRNHYQVIRDQINTLNNYKTLHDYFQQLDNTFSLLYSLRRQLRNSSASGAIDVTTWQSLAAEYRAFDDISNKLLDFSQRVSGEIEALWRKRLDQARVELAIAIKKQDATILDQSISMIDNVLSRDISRINAQLVASAYKIDLSTFMDEMKYLDDSIKEHEIIGLSGQQIEVIRTTHRDISQIEPELSHLIDTHNTFQELDDELRWIEVSMERDISELRSYWHNLQPKTQKLSSGKDNWSLRLNAASITLEQALADPKSGASEISEMFLDFRSQVNRSFNRLDWDLRNICSRLQTTADNLAVVLGVLR